MKVSHAEAERIQARIADLCRLRRAGPDDRLPTLEEIDASIAADARRYAAARRPPPVSTLTGRLLLELPEAFYRLGPLPLDPVEAAAECRRRRGLPPCST